MKWDWINHAYVSGWLANLLHPRVYCGLDTS